MMATYNEDAKMICGFMKVGMIILVMVVCSIAKKEGEELNKSNVVESNRIEVNTLI